MTETTPAPLTVAAEIKQLLSAGKVVVVATYGRAWQFDTPAHAECFKDSASGKPLMRQGRSWVDISGAAVKVYTRKAA